MRDESGQALAIVLGVMMILFLVLGAVIGWSSVASKQYGRENPNLQDRAALRSGVEGVIWELQNDGDGAKPTYQGTDVLDSAIAYGPTPTYSLCASTNICGQFSELSSSSVSATLRNPAKKLCIVGPNEVYEGTTVTYAAYATDGSSCNQGHIVSTGSFTVNWSWSEGGSPCPDSSGTSAQFVPPGDSCNEGQQHESQGDPDTLPSLSVSVSSSLSGVNGDTINVPVVEEQ